MGKADQAEAPMEAEAVLRPLLVALQDAGRSRMAHAESPVSTWAYWAGREAQAANDVIVVACSLLGVDL